MDYHTINFTSIVFSSFYEEYEPLEGVKNLTIYGHLGNNDGYFRFTFEPLDHSQEQFVSWSLAKHLTMYHQKNNDFEVTSDKDVGHLHVGDDVIIKVTSKPAQSLVDIKIRARLTNLELG